MKRYLENTYDARRFSELFSSRCYRSVRIGDRFGEKFHLAAFTCMSLANEWERCESCHSFLTLLPNIGPNVLSPNDDKSEAKIWGKQFGSNHRRTSWILISVSLNSERISCATLYHHISDIKTNFSSLPVAHGLLLPWCVNTEEGGGLKLCGCVLKTNLAWMRQPLPLRPSSRTGAGDESNRNKDDDDDGALDAQICSSPSRFA